MRGLVQVLYLIKAARRWCLLREKPRTQYLPVGSVGFDGCTAEVQFSSHEIGGNRFLLAFPYEGIADINCNTLPSLVVNQGRLYALLAVEAISTITRPWRMMEMLGSCGACGLLSYEDTPRLHSKLVQQGILTPRQVKAVTYYQTRGGFSSLDLPWSPSSAVKVIESAILSAGLEV